MIFDWIINFVFGVANLLLAPITTIGWAFSLVVASPLSSILAVIYYVLPISQLSPIIMCIVAIFVFRAVISLIKTIWQLLPVV